MTFAVGSLVRARGREWVVLPESANDLLILRPLGGTDDEVTGIYVPLETVEPARFDLPDPAKLGDEHSCRLLRDAVRLGFRSSAGPFRSFGRLAVEPRPYQLVPLLMALKLDPVRLLVADDVGVGKTVEAALVVRELLDRGEIERFVVLSPAHLADQWQRELRDKFHVDAETVLPSTAARLERNLAAGQSLFEIYPHLIVSIDFIKSDRRREDFLRACPELVIVEEAHNCAFAPSSGAGRRHQRHQLVRRLCEDPSRHVILVTATPHSGKEEEFRSLLGLLKPDFQDLPEDLSGKAHEQERRRLAAHIVLRRRGDLKQYMGTATVFPERDDVRPDPTYALSPEYRRLITKAVQYAQETVFDPKTDRRRQRILWWSALSLLRSLASSPRAAAETLRARSNTAEAPTPETADDIARRTLFDADVPETDEPADAVPGTEEADDEGSSERRRLLQMAREAEALEGNRDAKLQGGIGLVEDFLEAGYSPIVFCRFIPTAEYFKEHLQKKLGAAAEVAAVTGLVPHEDREARVLALARAEKRVLVATDCLSEGINLQDHFDAVIHYDLAWNPTRHEQREGRADRFGQKSARVRVATFYGHDNAIDPMIVDVLLQKHRTIRSSLGISVPVPFDSEKLLETLFEGVLRGRSGKQGTLFEDDYRNPRDEVHAAWDAAAEREKRSRSMFAQETIRVDEVEREVDAARSAVGGTLDVAAFVKDGLQLHGAVLSGTDPLRVDLREVPRALRDALGHQDGFQARFDLPVPKGVLHLGRSHPLVEGLATYVMDTALDPEGDGKASRAGAIRTRAVVRRTTALLIRFRFHIVTRRGDGEHAQLAEDVQVLAFEGAPEDARWLEKTAAEALLSAKAEANIAPEQAREFVRKVVEGIDALRPHLAEEARRRGEELLDAHRRVREAARARLAGLRVEPQGAPDVLGIYVYLPVA